jgi:ankyrin repeat protein
MCAVAKNSGSKIFKLLIENGADINHQNKENGYSLFHYAATAESDNVFAIVYLH